MIFTWKKCIWPSNSISGCPGCLSIQQTSHHLPSWPLHHEGRTHDFKVSVLLSKAVQWVESNLSSPASWCYYSGFQAFSDFLFVFMLWEISFFFFSFKIFLYIFSFLQLFCLFLKIEVQKKKLWYIDLYDRILFNHEKNEILVFVMTWMHLEYIMLSKTWDRERQIESYFSWCDVGL